jgi:hypothetical protein
MAMVDVERDTLSVKRLLASKDISASLAKRIVAADVDKNGELSLDEVVQVMQSEQKAVTDRRLFLRLLIAVGVSQLLLLAAATGMTYAVVEMSKDTKQDNGVLVTKDTGATLSTGVARDQFALADLYRFKPADVQHIDSITVEDGAGALNVLAVTSIKFQSPPQFQADSVTVTTAIGKSFLIDANGVHELDAAAPNGRRLLAVGSGKAAGTVSSPQVYMSDPECMARLSELGLFGNNAKKTCEVPLPVAGGAPSKSPPPPPPNPPPPCQSFGK